MSRFHEPVIGDEHDLATYGRPRTAGRSTSESRATTTDHGYNASPRAHASYDREAARARRVNSHRPAPLDHAKLNDRETLGKSDDELREEFVSGGVRTVKIGGQPTPPRRRSGNRSLAVQIDRYDRRPDRAAQWALFMGVFLIVVAVVTGS